MKKNVFTLLAFFMIAGAASAQTEAGSWMVGGNIELNTSDDDTRFTFSPSAGFFVANNFAAGLNFEFNKTNIVENKVTSFGVGPFARYYFGASNTRPFGHLQYNYMSTKTENSLASDTYNGGNIFLAGGLAAFINRNVALEALAGYSRSKFRHNDDATGGFRFKVGFQVYLSGSQMSRAAGQ